MRLPSAWSRPSDAVASHNSSALGEDAACPADGVSIAPHDGGGPPIDILAVPEPKTVKNRLRLACVEVGQEPDRT
jgi:hypothetical protein